MFHKSINYSPKSVHTVRCGTFGTIGWVEANRDCDIFKLDIKYKKKSIPNIKRWTLQTVRSYTFDNLRKSSFLLTMENSLCFCVRLRGICVPQTLWWALNSLTLIQRDHDIVRLREMTWHCKISQIRSVRGWFEIQYAMTHKNKFKYMYLLIQLHNSLLKM